MKKFIYTVVLLGLLFAYNSVNAAELFFNFHDLESTETKRQVEVNLFINTQDEEINAFQGTINLPGQSVRLKKIIAGNSIIPLWVERPYIKETGKIAFAGIIPGGFRSERGLLLTLNLEIDTPTSGIFTVTDGQALLHDGLGTRAKLTVKDFQIMPRTATSPPPIPVIRDNELPEKFVPQIQSEDSIYNGDWFVLFSTQDKGSGIAYYEIQESWFYKVDDNKWQRALSPYRLEDQRLRSYIFVKAVDKEGNSRLEILNPINPLAWYENYQIWAILVIGLVIPLVLLIIILRKLIKSLF